MNCSACGHLNREGARFCDACGAALAPTCPSCGTALRPGARFCDACGAPVAATTPAGEHRRRTVTVLFADLAGSTALQERLDPESARRLMGRWSAAMAAAIGAHGGRLEHFAGDGVLASWGVEQVREDDALRAVRAAWAMRTTLAAVNDDLEAEFGQRLRMRTGVHTGEVVVSAEGFLIGDTMNTAARLEQNAPEGEVLVGAITRRLVRDAVGLVPAAPVTAKGKREPLPAWRVVSIEAGAVTPDTPFVGREQEQARLRAAFAQAVATRSCRLAVVVGSPGLGKSRLAAEVVASLDGAARVVHVRCEPFGEGAGRLPVAGLLRDLAGIADGDDVAARLRAALEPGHPRADRIVAAAAGLLGAAAPASAEEAFLAVRRLLEAAAAREPLVVAIDDVHWAPPQFLDLLEHLVEWIGDVPILLLALTRPELREQREALTRAGGGGRAHVVVELAPLEAQESRAMVEALLDGAELPGRVLETAAGNPLFLGELVRMLVDDGALERRNGGWTVAADAELDIPASISALLSARLGRLAPDERAVVERASVLGNQFYRGAVAELVLAPVAQGLDRHLEALRRKDLVEPEGSYWIDEPVFRFHHALIRDAAYRGLLREARADLHERFAGWLEAKAGASAGEHEEVVGFHLEQAHEHRRALGRLDAQGVALGDRAAARLASAGRRALARDDFAAAAALLGRALACASDPDPLVRFDRCTALLGDGDLDASAEEVAALEALAERDPQARPVADVAAVATEGLRVGSSRAAQERLDHAIEALRRGGPTRVLAHALSGKAHFCVLYQGRHELGERLLEEALPAARGGGDERSTADVLSLMPLVALWGPSPLSRASARCADVLESVHGSHKMEAQTRCVQGLLEAMRGDHEASAGLLDAARETFTELGLALDLVDVDLFAARALLLAGRPADAEACARRAMAGPGGLGAVARSLLAQALLERDPAAALAAADEVLAEVDADNLRPFVAASAVRAAVLSGRGEHEAAIAAARAALAATERTDAAVQHAEALEALAAVQAAVGDGAAAATRAAALAAYEAKEHAVGARRLREA